MRIAHLTDVHVQTERGGDAGFAACLNHVQANHRPDLVLFGGDCVFDVNGTPADRTRALGDLWKRVIKSDLSTPSHACIGNHDVPNIAAVTNADDAKKWACDLLGLDKRHYSFDQGGWHIVMLDDALPGGPHGYAGKLDEVQFAWLEADLAATSPATPVVIVSHIPILSVCIFGEAALAESGDWRVPNSYMHIDAPRLLDLFKKHPNVKLCLSGHEHQFDSCVYNGVTYVCSGAVCGGWWGGAVDQTDAGYSIVDLFENGEFDVKYITYGWIARPE